MYGVSITIEELLALRTLANKLQLPQQKISNNSSQGNFRSSFRGRGMDFVETRVYQPGDDIRAINWAVTARTGKPHTKIYQQERDRPVYLIVDFSSSMFFGTRKAFKSVIASQIATLIAWAALKNGDRIGALLLKHNFEVLPPHHGKQNMIELLKQLASFTTTQSQKKVDYKNAFRRLQKTLKSGSLIYLISDFYNLEPHFHTELQILAKQNEVTNLLVYDPLEKQPPKEGRYLFRHPATDKSLLVDTRSALLCTQYRQLFSERQSALKKLCFATGMNLTEIATNDELSTVLRQVLNKA